MPSSPTYRSDPDAYWCGPFGAAMYLVIDGLNRVGVEIWRLIWRNALTG